MSARRPCFCPIRISRAILRPVDMPGSVRSEYGEPAMNRFVPATIRVEISNTLNSSLSVTIVSRQNGPIMPPNSSIDRSTTCSPISNAFGKRDSRRTTGMLPVTTKVGRSPIFRRASWAPNLYISSMFASSRRSTPSISSDPRERREHLGAHVLDEGTVRHGDDLLRDQVLRLIEDVRIRIDDQEVVRFRQGEGVVEPRLFPNRNPESPEALLAGAMKDLEGGMGTDRRDHDVPVVRED